jgi:hypothetical protein
MKYFLFSMILGLTGCAGLTQGWKPSPVEHIQSKEIAPGMTKDEIREINGDPETVQVFGNMTVWKYAKWKAFAGNQPYYAVFDESGKLYAYYMDEGEYRRNQEAWMKAFPPKQKQEIDLTVK